MKIVNRPKRTTAELIALINQRQADWWPAEFRLTIERSAEHDWVAIVDSSADRRPDFASSLDDGFHETGINEASEHGTGRMLVDSLFQKI
jgi:hypothetical protein